MDTNHYSDPITGFFDYLDVSKNIHNTLACWHSTYNGLWEICLETANSPSERTPWYKIQLDNTKPKAEISIDGGACNQYVKGIPITGKFSNS